MLDIKNDATAREVPRSRQSRGTRPERKKDPESHTPTRPLHPVRVVLAPMPMSVPTTAPRGTLPQLPATPPDQNEGTGARAILADPNGLWW